MQAPPTEHAPDWQTPAAVVTQPSCPTSRPHRKFDPQTLTTQSFAEVQDKPFATAHVFVFPSKYEGFGLPVLEALGQGCRTLLARTDVFQEIAGNTAEYFSPGDVSELTLKLIGILSDDPGFNPLLKVGCDKAAQFSWQKTASITADVYRSLLDQS